MWVKSAAGGRFVNISFFLVILAMVMGLLYFTAYEKWVSESSVAPENVATSTEVTLVANNPVKVLGSDQASKNTPLPEKTLSSWKSVMTTLFWVGEPADSDNAYITNTESYWDEKWQEQYGGVDNPTCRRGYAPCEFVPRENAFYFALPYAEYDEAGDFKVSAKRIPWYGKDSLPLLKNRWIVVRHGIATCYAQWEDVGPNGEDDFSYVFGKSKPTNTFGEKAGLDASPALWKCLQMSDNDVTEWAFVEAVDVPAGPWKDIVTTSGTSWGN